MTERTKAILGLVASFVMLVASGVMLYSIIIPSLSNKNKPVVSSAIAIVMDDYADEDNTADAVLYKQAVEAYIKHDYATAVALLKKQIQVKPKHAQSHYLLARIHEDIVLPGNDGKMLTEMKSNYLQYLELKPKGARDKTVRLKLSRYYMQKAVLSGDEHDYDSAYSLLSNLNQDDPDVKMILGTYYLAKNSKEGNYKAISEFETATKLTKEDQIAKYTSLGLAYLRLAKFYDAATALETAVTLGSESDYTFNNLGVAYLKSSRFVKAKESFEKAIKINPDNKKAAENLKWVLTNPEIKKRIRTEMENEQKLKKVTTKQ